MRANYRDIGVEVRDFGPSWRDGVAFLALIDSIKANLINLAEMRKTSITNKQRLNTAFDVAESKLGIARLLDADDVDVPKPEEKSVMTYVAQFLHKYPEPRVSEYFLYEKKISNKNQKISTKKKRKRTLLTKEKKSDSIYRVFLVKE